MWSLCENPLQGLHDSYEATLEAQAWHLLDVVQAGGHCQASLGQASRELMVPWEIGPPTPTPRHAGRASQISH